MLLEVWALLQVQALTQDLAHESAQEVEAGTLGLPLGRAIPGLGDQGGGQLATGKCSGQWALGERAECEVECTGQGWGKVEDHVVGGHNLKGGGL